jgi:hypothetical protein
MGLVEIDPEKLQLSDEGICLCKNCGMVYDVLAGVETLSKDIGSFEVEWDLSEQKTTVIASDNNSYTVSILLPLDISEEKLKTFLTFS